MADNTGQLLQVACDNAYDQYPDSCSHAVCSVIRARVNSNEEYRQANAMIVHIIGNWTEVTLDAGHELAQKGRVVVGGLKGTPNGHVIIISPSAKIESGGYEFFAKRQNKTLTMRSHGKYPPCMSTSIGS